MTPKITVTPRSIHPILCGHPWIFSGGIQKSIGLTDKTTTLLICNPDQEVIGHGFYSPESQIRVRVFALTNDETLPEINASFFEARIMAARRRRQRVGLPKEGITTGFRLLNSEGDGLPGATVDQWGNLLVFQLTTYAMDHYREAFVEGLKAAFADHDDLVILESAAPKAIAAREGIPPSEGLRWGHPPELVRFMESGLNYEIEIQNFQKTGHYADMRIHREWFASHSRGMRILDAYCYSGAFGLLAAKSGAREVVCVDSSRQALELVERNAALNQLSQVNTAVAKVDDFLRSAYDRNLCFDGIILDPPKLAPRKKHVKKALKYYESITLQALRLLEPQGILALGSCSEAIGLDELDRICSTVAGREGVSLSTIYAGTQAPDHPTPAGMKESKYLSFLAIQRA